jgi:hypothetical protein
MFAYGLSSSLDDRQSDLDWETLSTLEQTSVTVGSVERWRAWTSGQKKGLVDGPPQQQRLVLEHSASVQSKMSVTATTYDVKEQKTKPKTR